MKYNENEVQRKFSTTKINYLLECRGIVGAVSSDSNDLPPSGYV